MSHLNSMNSVFLTGKQDNDGCFSHNYWGLKKDKVHGTSLKKAQNGIRIYVLLCICLLTADF